MKPLAVLLTLLVFLSYAAAGEKSLDAAWGEIKLMMSKENLDNQTKIQKLEEFLKNYPGENPHQQQALWWIDQLGVKEEISVLQPRELKTKTEYFSFQALGGGYYGFSLGIALVTIRWEEFYLELVQVRGSLINGAAVSTGMVFGYHVHLGARARHEFRFGSGPAFALFDRQDVDFKGLAIVPQASYLYHVSKHFALEAVLSLVVAIVGDSQGDYPIPSPALTIGFRF